MDVVYGLNPPVRPLVVGSIISLILFLATVSQAMRYFQQYTGKNKSMDALAIWMLFLEFGHTVILGCLIGKTGVVNIQDKHLAIVRHFHQSSGIITSFTTFTTQLYFTWRFYRICGYARFSVMAALCTVAKTVGYCTSAIRFILHPNSVSSWTQWLWMGVGILSISTHAIISGGLYICYRRREGERMLLGPTHIRMIQPIDRAILRCIQADVLPSLFILAIMITYKKGAYPAWMLMTVNTGRLFTLSFFASLLSTRDILPEEPRIQDVHVSSSMANTSDMFPSPGPASIYNATIESESDQTEIHMVPIAKVISVDITIEANTS